MEEGIYNIRIACISQVMFSTAKSRLSTSMIRAPYEYFIRQTAHVARNEIAADCNSHTFEDELHETFEVTRNSFRQRFQITLFLSQNKLINYRQLNRN